MQLPCGTLESCISYRRNPTENEEIGLWSDTDGCMNCKLGKERELELARSRPPSPDISCIFCYEPLVTTSRTKRKHPVCKVCYGEHLSNYALGKGKTRWGVVGKPPRTMADVVAERQRI